MADIDTNVIHTGDCLDVLGDLPPESIHACVTDPPYGLAFMGRDWDDFDPKEYQQFCENWARELKRVLKPGAHLLAFSGNRTHHRLFSGVEDAGFEVRDTVTWHYGSGFPKALDVSKAIDKAADAEREVVGEKKYARNPASFSNNRNSHQVRDGGFHDDTTEEIREKTAPATDAAERWDGFKTALKPATEFVVVARKPFDGTVAENVQQHGTGALNIDGCRVDNDIDEVTTTTRTSERNQNAYADAEQSDIASASPEGRYPANVVFGERAADALDSEVDTATGGDGHLHQDKDPNGNVYGEVKEAKQTLYGDQSHGGPSRYFYTSKATKAERTLDGRIDNAHPTVKPADLMEWLVKLVTADGQVVIDPFAGSGTTLRAAKDLDRQFVGIERDPEWSDVARVRTGLTPDDPATVRGDDDQQGLEQF